MNNTYFIGLILVTFCCLTKVNAQRVGIGLNTPLDQLHVNGITRTTGINLIGNSFIETGFGLLGKEVNAGKIGYALFTSNTLDVVGAGNTYLERKIKFWGEAVCTFEGGATFNGTVGINNFSPTQRLEVTGKIKIGNDVNVPTAGTVRYNSATQDFEGFDGTIWKSFTKLIP